MALVPGFFSCLRGVAKVLKRTDVECFGRRLLDGSRLQIYADWSRRGEGWATCRLRQCPSSADKSQQRYEERFQVPVLSRTREFDKSSVSICDGMKSCRNRRWANREVLVNVPCGTRECLQRAWAAEGPKVR